MPDPDDPYWKLKPPPPTPVDEICACADDPPIVLQVTHSPNPLACVACNLEVPPERIGFPEDLAERLASYRRFHNCFDDLWLDSGEFESWAKAQLEDPESPVNQRGRALVADLNAHHRAYFWWFQDQSVDDFRPRETCPVCGTALVSLTARFGRLVCEPCSIVVAT